MLKGDDRIKKITLKRMDPKSLSQPKPPVDNSKQSEPAKKETEKKVD